MTPDELLRERKRRELLARVNDASNTTPSADEALVSDNAKQSLKAAGHWAGVLGKRAAEITKQGAFIAAERTRAAAAVASEKARQSQEAAAAKRAAAERSKAMTLPRTPLAASEPATDPAGGPVTDGRGNVGDTALPCAEPGTAPFEGVTPADVSHALDGFSDLAVEEAAELTPAIEPTIDPTHAPLPEDPMGELPPLPDDAYSEEPTQQLDDTIPARLRRRLILALLGAGLVGAGVAAFAWLGRDDATPAPIPVIAPIAEAPSASPEATPSSASLETDASPMTTPVELVPVQPEPDPVEAIEAGSLPEPEQALPPPASRTSAEAKAPAPERPRAANAPERRPATRSAPRAPTPAPVNDPQWQRQADADLDAWAKRAGLD